MKKIIILGVFISLLVGCASPRGKRGGIRPEDGVKTVILHGKSYTLPFKLEELLDDGWVKGKYDEDLGEIPSMSTTSHYLSKGDDEISLSLINPTKKSTKKDLMVVSVRLSDSMYASEEYQIFGSVRFGDKQETVEKAMKDLPLLSLDAQYGYLTYGTRDESLSLSLSKRGNLESIEFESYGEWDLLDFDYYSKYLDEDDKEEDYTVTNINDLDELYGLMLDTSFENSTENKVKEKAEKNREENPLSKLLESETSSYGAYKIVGEIVNVEDNDGWLLYEIKDESGQTISIPNFAFNLVTKDVFKEGDQVTLYLSDVLVGDGLGDEVILGGLVIIAEVGETTYNYFK